MIPRTAKQRADDLKAIGAIVTKLPSFKRDEYQVVCPKCGKQATMGNWRAAFRKLGPGSKLYPFVPLGEATRIQGLDADLIWADCRIHVTACSGAETVVHGTEDSVRHSAMFAVHALRRAWDSATIGTREMLLDEIDFIMSDPTLSLMILDIRQRVIARTK